MRYIWYSAIFIIILGLVFWRSSMQSRADSFLYNLRSAFALPILTVVNIFKTNDLAEALRHLELENQSLRAELLRRSMQAPEMGPLYPAKISASYPYNNKSSITITGGTSNGFKFGMAVLAAPGIFLGQIMEVGRNWSEVRTIFDPSWELPVRIGSSQTAALLKGGASLMAGLIDKLKIVEPGDGVYVAAKNIPYGLKVGDIKKVKDNTGTAFKAADVLPPYSLGDLSQVFVVLE